MSTHRQQAIRSAILVSLILAILGFFVSPAGANDRLNGVQSQPAGRVETNTNPAPEGACAISPEFPEKIFRWCTLITRVAMSHEIDPNLIAALILQESGGHPAAYSHSGAVGLMQVMPRDGLATQFECPNGPCFANRPTIRELENPAFNVEYGTRMLANLIQKKGAVREALKAYGPMDTGYRYADKVLAIWERFGG